MAQTITPVVHGGPTRRYWLALFVHTAAAGAAAALSGLALGALGSALGAAETPAGVWIVAAVALLYALREAAGVPVPLPDRKRQVPEWWREFYSPTVAAGLYGAGLGVGFFTHLSFGTYVAVVAGALASGDPSVGALLCTPFGIARGLAVGVGLLAHDEDRTEEVVEDIEKLFVTPLPRLVNAAALVAVGAAAIAAVA